MPTRRKSPRSSGDLPVPVNQETSHRIGYFLYSARWVPGICLESWATLQYRLPLQVRTLSESGSGRASAGRPGSRKYNVRSPEGEGGRERGRARAEMMWER